MLMSNFFYNELSGLLIYQEDAQALVSRLMNQLMKSDKYGERRGAAYGLAGVVKGFGISCLKKYGIVAELREGLMDRFGSSHFSDGLADLLSSLFYVNKNISLPLFIIFSSQLALYE